MKLPFSGGCACGAVRFRCEAEPVAMYNCHCRGCQKNSGAPFAAWLVMQSVMVGVRGDLADAYKADGDTHDRRACCTRCGTPLLAYSAQRKDIVLVNALALDDPSWFRAVADIWTAQAQPWIHFDTLIPKVLKSPPVLDGEPV